MRSWKFHWATLVVCAGWSSIACSGDTDPSDQSRTDVASTGGSSEDGVDGPAEVRDLSGNCQRHTVSEDASCSVAGLFCHDQYERRCICGGLVAPMPAAENDRDDRDDRDDRWDQRAEAPEMKWECLGEVPLGGGATGGLGGTAGDEPTREGLGGAER